MQTRTISAQPPTKHQISLQTGYEIGIQSYTDVNRAKITGVAEPLHNSISIYLYVWDYVKMTTHFCEASCVHESIFPSTKKEGRKKKQSTRTWMVNLVKLMMVILPFQCADLLLPKNYRHFVYHIFILIILLSWKYPSENELPSKGLHWKS